jgi:thiamine-monophosphate kinase
MDHPETTVKDLSEQGVLDLILPILTAGEVDPAAEEIGPGDDSAYVIPSPGSGFLVSVDAVVEGQDFLWVWPSGREHRPEDIGWKSIAQNLSDINAMGGVPRHVFLSLQCPGTTPVGRLTGIARGMREALDALAPGCRVSGGDLGIASELTSTVTVMGEPTGLPVRRSGASAGDTVAVAGRLGWASAGLAILLGEGHALRQPGSEELTRAQMRPRPPMHAGPAAVAAGATAMMDISDGLLRDAYRLARASGVCIDLDAAAVESLAAQLPAAAERPQSHVLTGGEDFALLATFPAGAVPAEFTAIGRIAEASDEAPNDTMVTLGGQRLPETGFDHFE